MSRNEKVIGIVILIAGLFILLGKIGVFAFIGGMMWPLLMFLAGIVLYVLTRAAWLPAIVMVPAGMLTMYGILFMASCWIHWNLFELLWPLLLIGVGSGLYSYCRYDPYHPRIAYQGALLFCGVGIAMFALMLISTIGVYIMAILLILVGAGLLFGRPRS